jgi:type I restriction enzyme S subunit
MQLATNQGFKNLVLSDEADVSFYYHLLKFISPEFIRRASGTTYLEISARELSKVVVPLPPLPEQRRIAEVLDAADEAIRQTERVIAKLREVKKGLLHDLLTRGLDADGNLRDPDAHPEQFKDSPLGRIPREWEVMKCGEVFSLSSGSPKTQRAMDMEEGKLIPVYGGNGIIGYTSKPLHSRNTIVIGRVGEYCGSVHLVEQPAWITDNALYITHFDSVFTLSFTHYYLKWFNLRRVRKQTGQPLVTQSAINEVPILKLDISEQRRIAKVLDAHDARIRAEEATLDKLHQVKRGLMDDLLTGRVRVG